MHAVGTALGAVKNELKAAYGTNHLATAAGEHVALSENARDLAQTVQKIEQVATKKVASQVADQLINAEKHLEKSTTILPKCSAELIKQLQTSLENILKDTILGDKTTGRARQYIKQGSYDNAVKDFYSLNPSNIQKIPGKEGLHGILPDGRNVNVRIKSDHGAPTLEIMKPGGSGTRIKIRYENKT